MGPRVLCDSGALAGRLRRGFLEQRHGHGGGHRQVVALVDFSRAARRDLEEEAKAEIGILSGYLPKGMEPSELKSLVAEMVTKLKAEGVAEFGKVMGRVMKEVKGRADGETVAEAVREALESK